MRRLGRLHRLFVDVAHFAAGKIVEPVEVFLVRRHGDGRSCLVEEDDRFLQHPSSLLHILPHRVKVRCQINGSRENARLVLALGLAVELLPPLCHKPERRLVGSEDFHMLAGVREHLAVHGVLRLDALHAAGERFLALLCRALHQLFNVDAADRDGKKTDRRQDRISAADIVGHDEGLIAFLGCKRLERALCLVGRGVDPLARAFLAVLLFQHLFKNAERNRRLGRRAGLRDDVHGEITIADHGNDLRQRVGGNAVAREINIGRRFLQHIIVGAAQQFNHRARAEIAAADADDDERPGIGLDFLCRLLNAGELLLVVVHGQVDPADEIASRARAVFQHVDGALRLLHKAALRQKFLCAASINSYHNYFLQVSDFQHLTVRPGAASPRRSYRRRFPALPESVCRASYKSTFPSSARAAEQRGTLPRRTRRRRWQ